MTNNFTILRLALALMVVLPHFRWLSGENFEDFSFPFIYGGFAVQGFFVVSGYLITGSFVRDKNLGRFYCRRFFRIYPLYLAVISAQTMIMAAFVTGGVLHNLMQLARYFVFNAVFLNFLQLDVGNVLSITHDHGLNASLWTLKLEVAFYLILPAIWWATSKWGMWILLLIFVGSSIYFEVLVRTGHYDFAKQLPGQLRFFVLGIAAYVYRDKLPLKNWTSIAWTVGLAILVSLMIAEKWTPPVVYPIGVGALILVTALRAPPVKLSTDISYGVYLLHAPVIQLSILLGLHSDTPSCLIATLALVIILALLAERYIETPFIAIGHRLTRQPERVPIHPYST